MLKPIVAATDGSPESVTAVRWAVRLAQRMRAPTAVLDVLHQPYAEMPPDDAQRFEADTRSALMERLSGAGIEVDEARAVIGDVERVLTEASYDATLLVLGSAERAGWGRHGHFSLVHALAHHVACPLVVIPAGPWSDREPIVIVGIDGTDASRVMLNWAIELGRQSAMRVVAAFVVDPMYATFDSAGWYGSKERAATRESAEDAIELIERFGADPAVSLEAIAEETRASLVVVGAKDHRSLGGALLGAIPDELLHHPTCPIAVLPHSMVMSLQAAAAAEAR